MLHRDHYEGPRCLPADGERLRRRELRSLGHGDWAFWLDPDGTLWIRSPNRLPHSVDGFSVCRFWPFYRNFETISLAFQTLQGAVFQITDCTYPQQTSAIGRGMLLAGGSQFALLHDRDHLDELTAQGRGRLMHQTGWWADAEVPQGWSSVGNDLWWAVGCSDSCGWVLAYHPAQGMFVQAPPLVDARWPSILVSPQFLYLSWWCHDEIHCELRTPWGWPESAVCQHFVLTAADPGPIGLCHHDTRIEVQWLSRGKLRTTDWESQRTVFQPGHGLSFDSHLSYAGRHWAQYRFHRPSASSRQIPVPADPPSPIAPGPLSPGSAPVHQDPATFPLVVSKISLDHRPRCRYISKLRRDLGSSWRILSNHKQ